MPIHLSGCSTRGRRARRPPTSSALRAVIAVPARAASRWSHRPWRCATSAIRATGSSAWSRSCRRRPPRRRAGGQRRGRRAQRPRASRRAARRRRRWPAGAVSAPNTASSAAFEIGYPFLVRGVGQRRSAPSAGLRRSCEAARTLTRARRRARRRRARALINNTSKVDRRAEAVLARPLPMTTFSTSVPRGSSPFSCTSSPAPLTRSAGADGEVSVRGSSAKTVRR